MTASSSENDISPAEDTQLPTSSIREIMGLEVEHLLPGLALAAKMLKQGDEEGALRTYATLVLCEPTEPRFQIGLAACALKIGLHAVALQAASAVIAFIPESPEGYHLSAHACVGLGEFDFAIEDFTEALRIARDAGNEILASDSERMLERVAIMKERRNINEDADDSDNVGTATTNSTAPVAAS